MTTQVELVETEDSRRGVGAKVRVAVHPPEYPSGVIVFYSDEHGRHSFAVRTDRFGIAGRLRLLWYRLHGLRP